MADMKQIEKLIEVLKLDEDSNVLDLGCGAGRISEYISNSTKANLLGIDYAKKAIVNATKRTIDRSARVTFQHLDFNKINLPEKSFDTIISIDTIYFVDDLEKSIGKLKKMIKPNGKIAIFYSTMIKPDESKELLLPDRTKLADALKNNNLKFTTYDFTKSEKCYWKLVKETVEKMKKDFVEEGNEIIYFSRKRESEGWLKFVKSNRICRYLYYITVA